MTRRIYLDNAATSFPKPESVSQAMLDFAQNIGASAGRGAYREAIESGELLSDTRRLIAQLIHASDPNHIIMTFNCTDGLTLAIRGLVTKPNSHVITTCMDHNSVLRPLHSLQSNLGVEISHVAADGAGLVDPEDIRLAIRPHTALIAVVHGSNVCGSVQDIDAIGQIARQHDVPFLVDAAQTAGHMTIDVQTTPVDLLAFPGHKALLGPLGTGMLYIRPGFESKLQPVREGGTGSKSELAIQPEFMPDRFEAGSHNAIGIAGLQAALRFILERSVEAIHTYDSDLCRTFIAGTRNIKHLKVYGPQEPERRVGVFSINISGYEPTELAAVLEGQFGLLTRAGLHCAPLAHQALNTFICGGTTRISTGPFTTVEDIEYAVDTLAQIAQMQPAT